ncbi:unnamed protein product [Effrenium voratum]|nr:unnamed protein product [Effrenium voratum]
MDLAHLRHIGLLDYEPKLATGEACQPPEPLDVPGAQGSRWSPQSLAETLQKLPVAKLFPELCAEVMEIIGRWYQHFSLRLWSRMMKVTKGSAHQVPCVLKELNESAPVIARVRKWVAELPASSPKAVILDLGAGFGFLSMFLSELLPPEKVKEFCLMDMSYPNSGVDNSNGTTSVEHIYKQPWRIHMYTLKVDLKKKATLNQIAQRLLSAPSQSNDPRPAPVFACGVHLCNTLGIRAAQLFNENSEVAGFAFVPCCFPTSRHVSQQVVYQLGEHRFAAVEFLDPKKVPSNAARFQCWAQHIVEGLAPGCGGSKELQRHGLHKGSNGMFAQDIYIFAERPLHATPVQVDVRGTCVVVDAKFGHAKAKRKAEKQKLEKEIRAWGFRFALGTASVDGGLSRWRRRRAPGAPELPRAKAVARVSAGQRKAWRSP